MNEEEYLKNRVEDQIAWYDRKSATNKKLFNGLKIAEIIIALSIPFLANFIIEGNVSMKYVIGFLGVIVAAIAGLISLMKYQENWIEYRTTAESLKHEKFLFLTKSGPYSHSAALERFVERVENLISKENSNWAQFIKTDKGDEDPKKEVV